MIMSRFTVFGDLWVNFFPTSYNYGKDFWWKGGMSIESDETIGKDEIYDSVAGSL